MSRKETGAFGIDYTIVSVFCGRYRGMVTYRCREGSLGERSGVHWASWLRAERSSRSLFVAWWPNAVATGARCWVRADPGRAHRAWLSEAENEIVLAFVLHR